ncbi:MAG: ferritin-like domain-containing protein [Thiogranum sp.]|nr:ferritin-like domain-containing protein [Thiogranum sp.]
MDSSPTFKGGPGKDEVQIIHDEELAHARMLAQTLEELGADPTAVTPSADLVAVEAQGIGSVLADPRTTVGHCLHALLVAELVDGEGWTMLRSLSEEMGQKDLAGRFSEAEQEEERHLEWVRSWLTAHSRSESEIL